MMALLAWLVLHGPEDAPAQSSADINPAGIMVALLLIAAVVGFIWWADRRGGDPILIAIGAVALSVAGALVDHPPTRGS